MKKEERGMKERGKRNENGNGNFHQNGFGNSREID
jgi:hypothetical protein